MHNYYDQIIYEIFLILSLLFPEFQFDEAVTSVEDSEDVTDNTRVCYDTDPDEEEASKLKASSKLQ